MWPTKNYLQGYNKIVIIIGHFNIFTYLLRDLLSISFTSSAVEENRFRRCWRNLIPGVKTGRDPRQENTRSIFPSLLSLTCKCPPPTASHNCWNIVQREESIKLFQNRLVSARTPAMMLTCPFVFSEFSVFFPPFSSSLVSFFSLREKKIRTMLKQVEITVILARCGTKSR